MALGLGMGTLASARTAAVARIQAHLSAHNRFEG